MIEIALFLLCSINLYFIFLKLKITSGFICISQLLKENYLKMFVKCIDLMNLNCYSMLKEDYE